MTQDKTETKAAPRFMVLYTASSGECKQSQMYRDFYTSETEARATFADELPTAQERYSVVQLVEPVKPEQWIIEHNGNCSTALAPEWFRTSDGPFTSEADARAHYPDGTMACYRYVCIDKPAPSETDNYRAAYAALEALIVEKDEKIAKLEDEASKLRGLLVDERDRANNLEAQCEQARKERDEAIVKCNRALALVNRVSDAIKALQDVAEVKS